MSHESPAVVGDDSAGPNSWCERRHQTEHRLRLLGLSVPGTAIVMGVVAESRTRPLR